MRRVVALVALSACATVDAHPRITTAVAITATCSVVVGMGTRDTQGNARAFGTGALVGLGISTLVLYELSRDDSPATPAPPPPKWQPPEPIVEPPRPEPPADPPPTRTPHAVTVTFPGGGSDTTSHGSAGAGRGITESAACADAKRNLEASLIDDCGAGIADHTLEDPCSCSVGNDGAWCVTYSEVTCATSPADTVAVGIGSGGQATATAAAVEHARAICGANRLSATTAAPECTCYAHASCVCLVAATCDP